MSSLPLVKLDTHIPRFRDLERKGRGSELIRRSLRPEFLPTGQRQEFRILQQQLLAQDILNVFGHCRAATDTYWLLMGGRDLNHVPLVVKKESMPEAKVHFWVEAGGVVVDVTAAQLTPTLYPAHNYANGVECRIGDNRGKQLASIDTVEYKLPRTTFSVLCEAITELETCVGSPNNISHSPS